MILVLVVVTAMVQAWVATVEIPVIRDIVCYTVDPVLLSPKTICGKISPGEGMTDGK